MSAVAAVERLTWPAALLLVAIVFGAMATYAPMAALAAAAVVICIIFVTRDANNVLLLSVAILPFVYAPGFETNLLGIPGMKAGNLVLAATLAAGVLKGGMFRSSDRLERFAKYALLIYFIVFSIEFARSLPNLDHFRSLLPLQFEAEPLRYTLSYYVRSVLFVVPFVFILTHMKDQTDRILLALSSAMFVLSCVIIIAVMLEPGVLGDGRNAVEELCDRYLGLHYNTVGTIYLTIGPLLVYLARTRSLFGIANLALAVLVILVLQSRSALVVFALSAIVTLILIRRTAFLVAGAVVVGLVSAFWLGPSAAALLSIGIDQGSVYSVDELFTGRVDYIWLPLLREWLADPLLFLFGAGRYGILTSPLWVNGQIIRTMHAHNAFLDFFLDSGAVLTVMLIGAIIAWLVWSLRVGRRLKSPLFWALFMCVVAYLTGTLTERQFFPAIDNALLFPILALLINVVRSGSILGEPGRATDHQDVAFGTPARPGDARAMQRRSGPVPGR